MTKAGEKLLKNESDFIGQISHNLFDCFQMNTA